MLNRLSLSVERASAVQNGATLVSSDLALNKRGRWYDLDTFRTKDVLVGRLIEADNTISSDGILLKETMQQVGERSV